MEVELIILSSASEEVGWLWDLLSEISMWEKPISPILIHCDSTTTIGRVRKKYYNRKSWSIRRKHSTVRSYINNGTINVDYIRNGDNIVDPFTKALAREKIWIISRGMGLKPKEEWIAYEDTQPRDWRSQELGLKGKTNHRVVWITCTKFNFVPP